MEEVSSCVRAINSRRITTSIRFYPASLLSRKFYEYCNPDIFDLRYGFEQPEMLPDPPAKLRPIMMPPKPTGYGNEEDSLSSFLNLIPRRPKPNHKKFMSFQGVSFKWKLKFHSPFPGEEDAILHLTLYPADDTLKITKLPRRNDPGGTFFKGRILNPETNQFYTPFDFEVGKKVTINKWRLKVLDEVRQKLALKNKI